MKTNSPMLDGMETAIYMMFAVSMTEGKRELFFNWNFFCWFMVTSFAVGLGRIIIKAVIYGISEASP